MKNKLAANLKDRHVGLSLLLLALALTIFACSSDDGGNPSSGDPSSSSVDNGGSSSSGGDGGSSSGGSSSSIYNQCDGYDPTTQFCNDNGVYDKCEGMDYDPSKQFCSMQDSKLYDRCKSTYNTNTMGCCNNNEVYNINSRGCCGSTVFVLSTHSCDNGSIISRCGDYNSSTQVCSNGTVKDKSEFTDERDGKVYKYVEIGSQSWMAENLNYETEGGKCLNEIQENCTAHGMLYDWATAMGFESNCNSHNSSCISNANAKHRGICPTGWHIPNNTEWKMLVDFIGTTTRTDNIVLSDNSVVGTILKAIDGWGKSIYGENRGGTDNYGFSALPSGKAYPDFDSDGRIIPDSFSFGGGTYYWSANEHIDKSFAYSRELFFYCYGDHVTSCINDFQSKSEKKFDLFSIRCIKD